MPLKEKIRRAKVKGQSRTGWSRIALAYGCVLCAAVLPLLSLMAGFIGSDVCEGGFECLGPAFIGLFAAAVLAVLGLIVGGGLIGLGWWWGLTAAVLFAAAAGGGFPALVALAIAVATPALAARLTQPGTSAKFRLGCAVALTLALLAGSLITAEARDRARAADHLRDVTAIGVQPVDTELPGWTVGPVSPREADQVGPDRLSYHFRSGEISVRVDVVGPNSGLEPPGDCELGDADNQDRCAESVPGVFMPTRNGGDTEALDRVVVVGDARVFLSDETFIGNDEVDFLEVVAPMDELAQSLVPVEVEELLAREE